MGMRMSLEDPTVLTNFGFEFRAESRMLREYSFNQSFTDLSTAMCNGEGDRLVLGRRQVLFEDGDEVAKKNRSVEGFGCEKASYIGIHAGLEVLGHCGCNSRRL